MTRWIGWVLLLAVAFAAGCSSEGERGRWTTAPSRRRGLS
jgi:hypothetical protein